MSATSTHAGNGYAVRPPPGDKVLGAISGARSLVVAYRAGDPSMSRDTARERAVENLREAIALLEAEREAE